MNRCPWCGDDSLMTAYHDKEWGKPMEGRSADFAKDGKKSASSAMDGRQIEESADFAKDGKKSASSAMDGRQIEESADFAKDGKAEAGIRDAVADRSHFEFLVLESAQAGLSWRTILYKREHYRREYAEFNAQIVADYGDEDFERLMRSGIVKNRLKILASFNNAHLFLDVQKEFGSFDAYLKTFTGGKIIDNKPQTMADIPAKTELSDKIASDLKKRGFKFLGSTIMYAHLQAVGIVNNHLLSCPFR